MSRRLTEGHFVTRFYYFEGQGSEGHEGHRQGQGVEADGGRGRVHQGQEVGRGVGETTLGLLRVLRRRRRAVSRNHDLGDRKFLS
jgi:hypothetical protein